MNKKQFKSVFLILVLIIVGLIILSLGLFNMNGKLKLQIYNLNSEMELLNKNITSAIKEISKKNNEISKNNEEISKNIDMLKSQDEEINNLNKEKEMISLKVESIKEEIDDFKYEIDNANSWFKSNSNIANYDVYKSVKSYILKCLTTDSDSNCILKVGCLSWVHSILKEFEYKNDITTSEAEDKLQSLEDFYNNGGGDCEDYSLVVNAEINYLRDYCSEHNRGNLTFEAIKEGKGNYYFTKKETWYYPNSAPFFIPNNYVFSYVVCGNFPAELDPNSELSGEIVGHCVIAFTDKEIINSEDVHSSLVNAILIEPQSGFISYDLRNDNTMYISKNGKSSQGKSYYIYSVITYDDYYLFDDFDTYSWRGYKDFSKEAEELKNKFSI
ncbi:MAG: hypothetical protein ABH824_04995 [Nanoarchaeota archaeon]|nr:hypothetical protein [Nanoarchaeota archaeon]MBU1632478.1 hypothetical protein [Nanoarchaeota archaeon]MBU1875988.1 hypothetical protein [Nanoarchaeota archaeon]